MQASKNSEQPTIEFSGGPFDGYLQPCYLPLSRLPIDVVWLVCSDALRQIHMQHKVERSTGGNLTSAALYELDTTADPLRYRHVGSISAKCFRTLLQNLNPQKSG